MKLFFLKNSLRLITVLILLNAPACRNASTGVHKNDFDSVRALPPASNAGNYNGNASGPTIMDSMQDRDNPDSAMRNDKKMNY